MASEDGRTDTALSRKLFEESYRFDFFQAVRLLGRIYPERLPVGRNDDAPAREVVRFRTHPSLQFPASQIDELRFPREERPREDGAESSGRSAETAKPLQPEMVVSFMGIIGPLGVLPTHYTELVAERVRLKKDTKLWEFLDLFNHRMISFFYRAWEKHHFPVAYERGQHDYFTDYLFDIIGMGTRGLKNRMDLPDKGLLLYGGLISQRPHSASAVEAILEDYFAAPAAVEQFVGQWLKIEEDNLCRLGQANSALGLSTIAGAHVWDDQSKYRIRFGPLRLQKFMALIPVGRDFRPMSELARLLTGLEMDFDVQLLLKAEEVPDCILTTQQGALPPLLGWNTWLKTQPFRQDDGQVVLSAPAA